MVCPAAGLGCLHEASCLPPFPAPYQEAKSKEAGASSAADEGAESKPESLTPDEPAPGGPQAVSQPEELPEPGGGGAEQEQKAES